MLGTILHAGVIGDMQPQAIDFWLVSIPVLVLGAPLGAYIVSKISRLYIATLLYVIVVVQFATAVWIIQPGWSLLGFSATVFGFGLVLFFWLTRRPERIGEPLHSG